MANRAFEFLVIIGRFQPFHNGHLAAVIAALEQSRNVIVLVGSSHRPRSLLNPWVFSEREAMIRSALPRSLAHRVFVRPLVDVAQNDGLWAELVQQSVAAIVSADEGSAHRQAKIGLMSGGRGFAPRYTQFFPEWDPVDIPRTDDIRSAHIREAVFLSHPRPDGEGRVTRLDSVMSLVPQHVFARLRKFTDSPAFDALRVEADDLARHRAHSAASEQGPTVVAAGAVIVQSGYILLMERFARPGPAQWALPVVFIKDGEAIQECLLRALSEEFRIEVPTSIVASSIKSRGIFDYPHGSGSGRTLTHAFHIQLPQTPSLPKLTGRGDALTAFWLPLNELDPERMFENHHAICQRLLGRVH